jgi:hypothetical protein
MPRLSAAPITLTPEEENELQRLTRAHKTGQKLVERASMILLAAAGTAVHEIARQLGVWPKTVRHWRARRLSAPADTSSTARLTDAPRPGSPGTFTIEQICSIVAMTCERLEKSELPLSHWSRSELAREAGLLQNAPHRTVGDLSHNAAPDTT